MDTPHNGRVCAVNYASHLEISEYEKLTNYMGLYGSRDLSQFSPWH